MTAQHARLVVDADRRRALRSYDDGLTNEDRIVLETLGAEPGKTVARTAEMSKLSLAKVSMSLMKLSQIGLAEGRSDPENFRTSLYGLTREGLAALEAYYTVLHGQTVELAGLSVWTITRPS